VANSLAKILLLESLRVIRPGYPGVTWPFVSQCIWWYTILGRCIYGGIRLYIWWYTTLGRWHLNIFLSCVTSPELVEWVQFQFHMKILIIHEPGFNKRLLHVYSDITDKDRPVQISLIFQFKRVLSSHFSGTQARNTKHRTRSALTPSIRGVKADTSSPRM
jgi:hypothetical protein